MKKTMPVEVDFNASIAGDRLEIEYSVTNRTASPIFLLDRMDDPSSEQDAAHPYGTLDTNWAYVEVVPDGGSFKAVIRRCLGDFGAPGDPPIMPFGRSLAPGEKVFDKLRLSLPLKEFGARYPARKYEWRPEGTAYDNVTIDRAEFEIGWSAEFPPDLGKPYVEQFQLANESLWYMTPSGYHWLYPRQQISTSKTISVKWEGLR